VFQRKDVLTAAG